MSASSRTPGETVERQHGKEYPRYFRILAPVLSVVFTLALVEVTLALFFPIPFAAEVNMYFTADEYTGYRIEPNSTGAFGRIPTGTNSHGHRDRATTLEKPKGTLRVLVLGDSFTVGAGVRQEEAYPHLIEVMLNERFEAATIEVINSGTGGWQPFQYAQYLEHYGLQFDPDVILVGFYVGNDMYDQMSRTDQLPTASFGRRVWPQRANDAGIALWTKAKIILYSSSHLARIVTNRNRVVLADDVYASGPTTPRNGGRFSKDYLSLTKRLLVKHRKTGTATRAMAQTCVSQIGRIKQMADRGSIPLVVALIPDELQLNRSLVKAVVGDLGKLEAYDFTMPQRLLVTMLQEIGAESICLRETFLEDERRLYFNDTHWTPEGHLLAAGKMTETIVPIIDKIIREEEKGLG